MLMAAGAQKTTRALLILDAFGANYENGETAKTETKRKRMHARDWHCCAG